VSQRGDLSNSEVDYVPNVSVSLELEVAVGREVDAVDLEQE